MFLTTWGAICGIFKKVVEALREAMILETCGLAGITLRGLKEQGEIQDTQAQRWRTASWQERSAAVRRMRGKGKRATNRLIESLARGQATKVKNKQDKVDKAAGVTVQTGDPATNLE
ncbi:hypothetical protein B0H19DRAFT_1237717 [Mycena capillaripes]|nr:hypothetical protein B0H19DRAFT_1237717 [Mycena capillaripes]